MSLILEKRPRRITAGDTVVFKELHPKFGVDDFTLQFVIQSPTPVTFDADADHQVTITGAQTDGILESVYGCFYVFTEVATGFKTTIPLGNILILQNPTQVRILSQAEQDLDAALSNRRKLLARSLHSATVNGETYTVQSVAQMDQAIYRLMMQVNAERARAGRKPLSGGVKKIQTRFS